MNAIDIIPLWELIKVVCVLAYIGGVLSVFQSYFRAGINPNAPIPIIYNKKELLVIFIIIIFWPVFAVIEILKPNNKLRCE